MAWRKKDLDVEKLCFGVEKKGSRCSELVCLRGEKRVNFCFFNGTSSITSETPIGLVTVFKAGLSINFHFNPLKPPIPPIIPL